MPYQADLPALGVLRISDSGDATLDGVPMSRAEVYDAAQVFIHAAHLCDRGRRAIRRRAETDRRLETLADHNA